MTEGISLIRNPLQRDFVLRRYPAAAFDDRSVHPDDHMGILVEHQTRVGIRPNSMQCDIGRNRGIRLDHDSLPVFPPKEFAAVPDGYRIVVHGDCAPCTDGYRSTLRTPVGIECHGHIPGCRTFRDGYDRPVDIPADPDSEYIR